MSGDEDGDRLVSSSPSAVFISAIISRSRVPHLNASADSSAVSRQVRPEPACAGSCRLTPAQRRFRSARHLNYWSDELKSAEPFDHNWFGVGRKTTAMLRSTNFCRSSPEIGLFGAEQDHGRRPETRTAHAVGVSFSTKKRFVSVGPAERTGFEGLARALAVPLFRAILGWVKRATANKDTVGWLPTDLIGIEPFWFLPDGLRVACSRRRTAELVSLLS